MLTQSVHLVAHASHARQDYQELYHYHIRLACSFMLCFYFYSFFKILFLLPMEDLGDFLNLVLRL